MFTDPNHESPDVIDQRDPADPSHWDPRPGEPGVVPGITLPAELPEGWTLAPDGSAVPPDAAAAPVVTVLPEMTITASAPSSVAPLLLGGAAALVLLVLLVKGSS